ncbi:hypothetical protein BDN72DRAFT_142865 [Pluteus cervinus]|uniref:Uncharacterized protein n=1 Tax=Pluteus cervinus TaxID=181527 RepID=A0ACD3AKW6_9AGAR|nr:hypothetical protein BDN72DRAFT_142865 [Pluteus cervinus]
MSPDIAADANQQYACKCLNIRLHLAQTHQTSPNVASDPDFKLIFVGEHGISVVHPQVTLRNRTRATPVEGGSQHSRYTSVTCLLCEVLVYRVYQIISIEVEGRDGPLLPTEEWAEEEILKSSTGWVELHKGAITTDEIARLKVLSSYSALFDVVLPSDSDLADLTSEEEEQPRPSVLPPIPSPPPTPPKQYLESLRPIFPPPPFTPTHPVFAHLSALAEQRSQVIRGTAEKEISEAVQEKINQINQAEDGVRHQVETLWRRFRAGINNIEGVQESFASRRRASHSRERAHWPTATNGNHTNGSAIAVRTFDIVPATTPGPRDSTSIPRVSALSASLATTSFHHPRANEPSSPTPTSTASQSATRIGSAESLAGPTRASQSYPTVTAGNTEDPEGSNVLQFRRSTNDTINTAVSFQYFRDLEADMARHRRQQQKALQKKQTEADQANTAGPSTSTAGPQTNGDKKQEKGSEAEPAGETSHQPVQGDQQQPARGRGKEPSKGKRKVTFDVQPAVVTIKSEGNAEKEADNAATQSNDEEMIFEIEEEGSERTVEAKPPMLPLLEPAAQPRANSRKRGHNGLPRSFAGLRPASLPVPSNIRPRGPNGVDSSSSMRPYPVLVNLPQELPGGENAPSGSKDGLAGVLDPRDEEILKLVAADAPSHRGAWKTDSPAWRTFVRRSDGKITVLDSANGVTDDGRTEILGHVVVSSQTSTPDENEEDEETSFAFNIASSLPIAITPVRTPRTPLSLASYQPRTEIPQQVGSAPAVVHKPSSSASIRKAAYAERDRSRSMDPGALDFTAEEDESDDDEDDEELAGDELVSVAVHAQTSTSAANTAATTAANTIANSAHPNVTGPPANANDVAAGERGRKRALKILQKRSELPEPGMWRSLAS